MLWNIFVKDLDDRQAVFAQHCDHKDSFQLFAKLDARRAEVKAANPAQFFKLPACLEVLSKLPNKFFINSYHQPNISLQELQEIAKNLDGLNHSAKLEAKEDNKCVL